MTRMGLQMVKQTGQVFVLIAVKIGVSIDNVLSVLVMMLRM